MCSEERALCVQNHAAVESHDTTWVCPTKTLGIWCVSDFDFIFNYCTFRKLWLLTAFLPLPHEVRTHHLRTGALQLHCLLWLLFVPCPPRLWAPWGSLFSEAVLTCSSDLPWASRMVLATTHVLHKYLQSKLMKYGFVLSDSIWRNYLTPLWSYNVKYEFIR